MTVVRVMMPRQKHAARLQRVAETTTSCNCALIVVHQITSMTAANAGVRFHCHV